MARQNLPLLLSLPVAHGLTAFNLDSSQASVASGHGAEVKDDLLFGGFNGNGIACRALTELSDFQSPCLPHIRSHLIAPCIKGIFHPENSLTFLCTINL